MRRFSLEGKSGRDTFEALYRDYGVACAPASINDGIRLSPHVYNTFEDVDAVVEALGDLAA